MAKQLKRKSRKIRGGKLLGQGTYGCAFKPSLVCSGEPEPREGSISKMLISKADADKEYSISKAIIRIDPTKKFFITASGACLHDGRSRNNTVNSSGKPCKFNPSYAQKYLIFYPMGGEGHFSIIIQSDKYASAIKSFRNLLEGLSVFHRSNMVHLDIKPDNILSTIIDGEYKTRFIDFGLSVTDTTQLNPTSQIVNILSDHLYKNKHYFYPIDLLLMNTNSLIKSDPNRKNFLIDWYYNISHLEFYPTSTFLNPNGTKKITFDNLVVKYHNNSDFYNNTSSALKTVDIAALGISFAYMYSRLTGHYSRIDDYSGVNAVAIKKPGQIPVLINKLKLGDFGGQQDVFDWHVNLANKVSIPFYDLIIKMMDYDGLKRPTATEALTLFDRFMGDIDECFSDIDLTEKALYFVGIRTHSMGRLNLPPPDALRKRTEAEEATRARAQAEAATRARTQAEAVARAEGEVPPIEEDTVAFLRAQAAHDEAARTKAARAMLALAKEESIASARSKNNATRRARENAHKLQAELIASEIKRKRNSNRGPINNNLERTRRKYQEAKALNNIAKRKIEEHKLSRGNNTTVATEQVRAAYNEEKKLALQAQRARAKAAHSGIPVKQNAAAAYLAGFKNNKHSEWPRPILVGSDAPIKQNAAAAYLAGFTNNKYLPWPRQTLGSIRTHWQPPPVGKNPYSNIGL